MTPPTPAQQITALCRLPYKKQEQKIAGLFALPEQLAQEPADDEHHRLLARPYSELGYYQQAADHLRAITHKTRRDHKQQYQLDQAAQHIGLAHAQPRSPWQRRKKRLTEAIADTLKTLVTTIIEKTIR